MTYSWFQLVTRVTFLSTSHYVLLQIVFVKVVHRISQAVIPVAIIEADILNIHCTCIIRSCVHIILPLHHLLVSFDVMPHTHTHTHIHTHSRSPSPSPGPQDELKSRPRIAALLSSLRPVDSTSPNMAEGKGGKSKKKKKANLGTIMGVYLPTVQNILGVILFLRLSWIVGIAGVGMSFFIVFLCCCSVSHLCLSVCVFDQLE